MTVQDLPLRIRDVNDEDVPFIFNSWLRSYRETGLICRNVTNTVYYDSHHKVIQKILAKAQTYMACDPEDPSLVYGWICGEYISGAFVLHFIYVKQAFRRFGVGTALLGKFELTPGVPKCYTHHVDTAHRLAPKYAMMYQPYVLLVDFEKKRGIGEFKKDMPTITGKPQTVEKRVVIINDKAVEVSKKPKKRG